MIAPLVLAALGISGCGDSSSSSASGTASTSSPPARTSATRAAGSPASATGSASAGAHSATATAGTLTATLVAGTHSPKAQAAWPIHLTATLNGAPAHASVSYEYLFGGSVVAHRSHYSFTGRFSDVFRWPAMAVGYPLTFRAVITSAAQTVNLDYPVQVAR